MQKIAIYTSLIFNKKISENGDKGIKIKVQLLFFILVRVLV